MRPVAVILIALAIGVSACGDDDDTSDTKSATTAAAGDAKRYCALTRELDAKGEKFFANLGRDASPKDFEDAERRFVERFAEEIEEVQSSAPQDIRGDVEKLLAGLRQRAGLGSSTDISEAESSAAERRVQAWEKRNCDA